VHKMFVGHAPDYIPSLLLPASDIPSRSSLRQIMAWPWNLSQGLLTVIENGTIRKRGYGLLFAFHSNYGRTLYHCRDIAKYFVENCDFCHTSPAFDVPITVVPVGRILPLRLVWKKLEWYGYPAVKKYEDTFSRFDTIPACDGRTDGRTDILLRMIVCAMHCIAR